MVTLVCSVVGSVHFLILAIIFLYVYLCVHFEGLCKYIHIYSAISIDIT